MTIEEYKKRVGYKKGLESPRCANCKNSIKTKFLRCNEPVVVMEIGGYAVKPDDWCTLYNRKEEKQ
jgi:hypothetical protein